MRRTALAAALIALASACTPPAAPPSGPQAPVWTAQSPPDSIARWLRASCGSAARQECIERGLLGLLPTAGVPRAMEVLDRIAAADADVAREGHVFAHGIGIAAYQGPATVAERFAQCNPSWQSGCYHGVIQAYFADPAGGGDLSPEKLNALCAPHRTPATAWIQFHCAHGIGHGLMAVRSHNLLLALDDCDKLTDAQERGGCWGGAFMENVVNATRPHHTATTQTAAGEGHDHHGAHAEHASAGPPFKALDDDEPLYPCTVVADRHKASCYLMQTSAILYRNGGDFTGAARQCARVGGVLGDLCYISIGRDAAAYAGSDDADAVRRCRATGEAGFPSCVVGTVKNRIDVAAAIEPGLAYCTRVPEGPAAAACYRAVGEQVAILHGAPAARESACQAVPAAQREQCRIGSGLPRRNPAAQ